MQKMVLPSKYSWFLPRLGVFDFMVGFLRCDVVGNGVNWGDELPEESFSFPGMLRLDALAADSPFGSRKLDLKDRGDLTGVNGLGVWL